MWGICAEYINEYAFVIFDVFNLADAPIIKSLQHICIIKHNIMINHFKRKSWSFNHNVVIFLTSYVQNLSVTRAGGG